jgi:hypothetical protein
MAGGQEREIPRNITPQQGSRPDQKHSLEAGEGTRDISKPELGKPQQDKGEGQPLPNVQDILERRAQLYESRKRDLYQRQHKSKHSREYLALYDEHRDKVRQLGDEVASHYAEWTDHDRLIFDLYTTSVNWRIGLSAEETQQFIARATPLSKEKLIEELRKARETAERKAARYKKMAETQRLNRSLTAEERDRLAKEKDRERSRRWRQANPKKVEEYSRRARQMRSYMREEFGRHLQADESQPTQVFPRPANE